MELLIVFIIVTILSSIMKSFQGARKSSARPTVPGREKLKKLEDILSAEIERAKQRKSAPQYNREHDRQYERQEDYFPAEYRVEMQQPVLKKRSEQKKRSVSEPAPKAALKAAPATSSAFRLPKKNLRRVESDGDPKLQQLADLLSGENTALGILALEVFSPPRAKRPFQYRR